MPTSALGVVVLPMLMAQNLLVLVELLQMPMQVQADRKVQADSQQEGEQEMLCVQACAGIHIQGRVR